ncbi:hypothetical protein [Tsuneonella amylolytica]|uniref:hypothetical protein n=1 Tax=Tsuneonella amylolytica TaxID=2338327 RepID=UPI000EA867D8|nr:hypothetical protein [Tsuneonella amylolytica]
MGRRNATEPVTAQMYRHFAVATLAATAALAMFANGENREAVAREVEAAKPAPQADNNKLFRRSPHAAPPGQSAGGGGFDASFGQPMDAVGAAPQRSGSFAGIDQAAPVPVTTDGDDYGVLPEIWASLTQDEKKAVIAKVEAERAAAARPERARQIDDLMAASRARSGGSSGLPS